MGLLDQREKLLNEFNRLSYEQTENPQIDNSIPIQDLTFQLFMLSTKYENDVYNLVSRINYYSNKYYNNQPEVSDEQWDKLYFELCKLERVSGICLPESPTRAFNLPDIDIIQQIDKVNIPFSIPSKNIIQKTSNFQVVIDYYKDISETEEIIAMPDPYGMDCYLQYKNGKLTYALVENNGIFYDCKNRILGMSPYVPKRIEDNSEIIIKGKITCLIPKFYDKQKNEYKTISNFVEKCFFAEDYQKLQNFYSIDFLASDVIYGLNNILTLRSRLYYLSQLGFSTVVDVLYDKHSLEITSANYIIEWSARTGVGFSEIIFQLNAVQKQNQVLIYKCYNDHYHQTLKNLSWIFTFGSNDILIPELRCDPFYFSFGNLKIRHVSLKKVKSTDIINEIGENPWYGQELHIFKTACLGQELIESNLNNIPQNPIKTFPTLLSTCPYCGNEINLIQGFDDTFVYLMQCENPSCPGKFVNKIKHYFGENGLNISGFTPEMIEWLVTTKKWITRFVDIYTLKKYEKEWYAESNLEKVTIKNLLNEIEKSKSCSLKDFIAAMGIPSINKNTANFLANYFKTYENFSNTIFSITDENDNILNELSFLNKTQIENLINFNYEEFDLLWDIIKHEAMWNYDKNYFSMPLHKQTFVVVGPAKYFDSVEWLCGYIHGEGGAVVTEVTEDVDYVINNDPESNCPENIAARELGIPIITEQEFLGNIY